MRWQDKVETFVSSRDPRFIFIRLSLDRLDLVDHTHSLTQPCTPCIHPSTRPFIHGTYACIIMEPASAGA